jgi:hypothetical protein
MRARAERNGYKNGTKFGSLTSQIKYDPRLSDIREKMKPYCNRSGLFSTPQTSDKEDPLTDEQLEKYVAKYEKKGIMPSCAYQLRQAAVMGMLPTPCAHDAIGKSCSDKAKEMGMSWIQTLPDLVANLLPTPVMHDYKGRTNPGQKKAGCGNTYGELLPDMVYRMEQEGTLEPPKATTAANDGKTSRLSPLFTEEMMGFPLMWTALPFLSENGEPKPSKPTATPSSPK